MRFLVTLLVNGIIIYLCAAAFPTGIQVAGFTEAVVVALLLGIVNFFIRPIITVLTLPFTIVTLGLFLLVINGGMVLLVDWMLTGFQVNGWLWAILLSIILSLGNSLVSHSREKRD